MLVRFWVEGYRCFSKRTGIDFTNSKNYRFGTECVRGDFLDKMVLMGGNNAGKTSFGFAITDIISTVAGFSNDVGQNDADCFLNKDAVFDRATFHYEITHAGEYIAYEYAKSAPDRIVSECLMAGKRTVFRYDLTDGSASEFSDELDLCFSGFAPDGSHSLIQQIVSRRKLDGLNPVSIVRDFADQSLYYMAMWRMDVHIGVIEGEDDVEKYIIDTGLIELFNEFLNKTCSVDIRVVADGERLVVVRGNGRVPFRQAVSRGTMIMCRLYCWIRRCCDRSGLIFFDDFDDMFHYQTAENLIR